MKRMIACMLMTVVLLLSLLVPAAGELIEYDYPRNTVLLWNADENWGDRYTLDTQNQTEGEGCISINLNGVTGTHAPSKKLDPVDATGMLAFEFDMYISDLAILDHLQSVSSSSIEICSGGKCDEGEKNIPLSDVAKQLKNGCPKVGWNRVIVFLNKMRETKGSYGPFDISHINYFRIFWTGMTDCGQDWVLKFDNFVLTDREVAPGVPHTPGEWQYDEEKHRRYCTNCEELLAEALHCPEGGCESAGKCQVCGLECGPYEHEYAMGVQWDHSHIASVPTCTQAGRVYYYCMRCGQKSEQTYEYGDPLEHNPKGIYHSCEAQGHAQKCSYCDEIAGEVKAHDFGKWLTLKAATETEDGFQRRHCQTCSYYEGQTIPKTGTSTDGELGKGETPGCTSVVGGAGFCVVALMLAAGVAFRKKK